MAVKEEAPAPDLKAGSQLVVIPLVKNVLQMANSRMS
jgi:hypothetical protein